jgi:hypothetical protein
VTDRPLYQIDGDLSYSMRLWELHWRFWQRLSVVLTLVSLIGGAGAVASVVRASPTIATVAGVILAIVSAVSHALAPATRIAEGKERYRAYATLRAKSAGMDASSLDAELRSLEVSDYPTMDSLRDLAYEDNCIARGHDDTKKWKVIRFLRLV